MKRKYKSGKFKKNKKYKKSVSSKKIKYVVMKMLNKSIETKNKTIGTVRALGKSYLYPYNIFSTSGIDRGDGKHQFTGNTLNWKGIKIILDFQKRNDFFADTHIGVALVRANAYINTSNTGNEAAFRQAVSMDTTMDLDPDKCKIVWQKRLKMSLADLSVETNNTGVNRTLQYKTYIKMNKDIRFKALADNYDIKGGNYYLCFYAWSPVGTVGVAMVDMTLHWRVYFKDA